MKKQNGITLIALIITIIVMLILVGVTVNVALNGGLFSTAKEAVNKTQIELDKDTLLSAVIGAIGENGEVDFAVLDANLPEGFEGSNGTYKKEGNRYKVDQYGNVTYKEPSTGDLLLLEKYFLGENGDGKDWSFVLDAYPWIFKDDETTISDASTSLIFLIDVYDEDGDSIYVKYNEKEYKVSGGPHLIESIELVYEPQGREGEKVAYDSNNDGIDEEWIILYDNGDNVEMVSMSNMGTLTLGYEDPEAQSPGDIDKDGSSNTNIDKAIYSYNNAITRLNNYCERLVTKEDANLISVRSVGSNPSNPSSENTTLYTSSDLVNWLGGKYNRVGKSGDTNDKQDLVRIIYHGIAVTGEEYWMASRNVYDDSNNKAFRISCMDSDGFGRCYLWALRGNRRKHTRK